VFVVIFLWPFFRLFVLLIFVLFDGYSGRRPFDNSDGGVNNMKNLFIQFEKIKENECDNNILELCHSMLNLVC
jgi:hypothetical protein